VLRCGRLRGAGREVDGALADRVIGWRSRRSNGVRPRERGPMAFGPRPSRSWRRRLRTARSR